MGFVSPPPPKKKHKSGKILIDMGKERKIISSRHYHFAEFHFHPVDWHKALCCNTSVYSLPKNKHKIFTKNRSQVRKFVRKKWKRCFTSVKPGRSWFELHTLSHSCMCKIFTCNNRDGQSQQRSFVRLLLSCMLLCAHAFLLCVWGCLQRRAYGCESV